MCICCLFVVGLILYANINDIYLNNYIDNKEKIMAQITDEMNSRIDMLIEQMAHIENSQEFKNIVNVTEKIQAGEHVLFAEVIAEQKRFNNIIDSIYYYRDDGELFYDYTQSSLMREIDIEEEPWFSELENRGSYVLWYPSHNQKVLRLIPPKTLAVIKPIYYENKKQGILVFYLNEEWFKKRLNAVDVKESSYCALVDADWNVMLANSEDGENNDIIRDVAIETDSGYMENVGEILLYDTLSTNKWHFFFKINKSDVVGVENVFSTLLIISGIIGIIVAFLLMYFSSKWFSRPIVELQSVMKKIENNEMNVRWNCKSKNETFIYLERSFNKMLESINELILKISNEQQVNEDLNTRVIAEQLNSHFIYNVLNSIYYVAESGDYTNSAEMIYILAGFIRHGLNKGKMNTKMCDEVQHIKNYIALENFRYGNKIELKIEMDNEAGEVIVPKLILQPIVENSVLH